MSTHYEFNTQILEPAQEAVDTRTKRDLEEYGYDDEKRLYLTNRQNTLNDGARAFVDRLESMPDDYLENIIHLLTSPKFINGMFTSLHHEFESPALHCVKVGQRARELAEKYSEIPMLDLDQATIVHDDYGYDWHLPYESIVKDVMGGHDTPLPKLFGAIPSEYGWKHFFVHGHVAAANVRRDFPDVSDLSVNAISAHIPVQELIVYHGVPRNEQLATSDVARVLRKADFWTAAHDAEGGGKKRGLRRVYDPSGKIRVGK